LTCSMICAIWRLISLTDFTPWRTSPPNLSHFHHSRRHRATHLLTVRSMSRVATAVWSASRRISRATTEKPSPYSTRLLRLDRRVQRQQFVWSATFVMVVTMLVMASVFSLITASLPAIEPVRLPPAGAWSLPCGRARTARCPARASRGRGPSFDVAHGFHQLLDVAEFRGWRRPFPSSNSRIPWRWPPACWTWRQFPRRWTPSARWSAAPAPPGNQVLGHGLDGVQQLTRFRPTGPHYGVSG